MLALSYRRENNISETSHRMALAKFVNNVVDSSAIDAGMALKVNINGQVPTS